MKLLKIALIQCDIVFGEPEVNFERMKNRILEAVQQDANFIVLPELWTTAYDLKRIKSIGDRYGEQTKRFLQELAFHHQVTIVGGSIAEIQGDQVYNTTYVYNHKGELAGKYRKIHLFRLMDEEKYLAPGNSLETFELEDAKMGLSICYDLRFPELARSYALQGAKAMVVPAEWPHPRLHHWRTLLQARAIENQMFIIACNRVGKAFDTEFFGHSMVVDPWGEILIEGGEEEEILYTTIDLDLVESIRKRIPIFEDRRKDLY